MITTLHIRNIGIIEEISIDLNKGLNVLTGETGAGKTLIIDSLSILSGGRFSKEMIRKGENNSFVEACIYNPNHEKAIDGTIIISREIHSNGRNLCKINGRMVTVNELKEFMEDIIEIHGQHDNQNLLDSRHHIHYLDDFAGNKLKKEKEEYEENYKEYLAINKKLKENYGDSKERERKLDLLGYQYHEIKEAKLKIGEEEILMEKRNVMLNSEKIAENLQKADMAIGENSIDSISTAIRAIEKIEGIDVTYEEIGSNLKNIYYELQEIARDITNNCEEMHFNEQERDEVEERLNLIDSLKRKYGNSIQEILAYKQEIKEEIQTIENLEEINQNLRNKQTIIEQQMLETAKKLHEIREKKAKELSKKINQELEDLEMKNAKIHCKVEYKEKEYFCTGKDVVTLYIQTNLGEQEKELAKIASGGEMSRTMLAFKKVLAETDKTPILIFDEIDTGISGKAANQVAEKLTSIAQTHQVLCISHLPNIAAMADYNYFINKKIVEKRTCTGIQLLSEEEAVKEIARISSGEVNEISLKYATELRKKKAS